MDPVVYNIGEVNYMNEKIIKDLYMERTVMPTVVLTILTNHAVTSEPLAGVSIRGEVLAARTNATSTFKGVTDSKGSLVVREGVTAGARVNVVTFLEGYVDMHDHMTVVDEEGKDTQTHHISLSPELGVRYTRYKLSLQSKGKLTSQDFTARAVLNWDLLTDFDLHVESYDADGKRDCATHFRRKHCGNTQLDMDSIDVRLCPVKREIRLRWDNRHFRVAIPRP